jgi:hypothetical protein
MNVEIGTDAAQSLLLEIHKSKFICSVCTSDDIRKFCENKERLQVQRASEAPILERE